MEMNLPGWGCKYWETKGSSLVGSGPQQKPGSVLLHQRTHLKDETFKISLTDETDPHALK